MVVVSFVAAEDQLNSDRQPGGSWAFTSQLPCLALTHCAIQSPDRIFTMFWAPHHCNSELIWKASRIFLYIYIFGGSKSRQFAFVSVLKILLVNWDSQLSNMPKRVFLSDIILSPFCVTKFLTLFPQNFPRSIYQDYLFAVCEKWSNQIGPEDRSWRYHQKLGLISLSQCSSDGIKKILRH